MNKQFNTAKFSSSLLLMLLTSFVSAQSVEYVGATSVSSDGSTNYYYTKSVTLTIGTVISGTNGDFFITPIATNPPPSPEQNFVRVEVPKVPVSSETDLTNMGPDDKTVSYSYSDGLGRATMSSSAEVGPLYEDVVQHYEYDPTTGRQLKSFLPYAKAYSEGGAFIANADSELQSFYNGTANVPVDSKYYSESAYDDRGRMASSIGVGEAWNSNTNANDKTTDYDYVVHDPSITSNPIHDRILHWKIVSGSPQNDRDYAANELSVTVVTDVEGKMSRSVTDMRGLSITNQVYDPSTSKWYGSYNVYDDFGRVRFVVPPKIASSLDSSFPNSISSTQKNELVFQYEYDDRGRVEKDKAPGAGWTEYIYDQWDRLIMSRHEAQQYEGVNSWTFLKYDALNRLVASGEVKTTKTRAQILADPDFDNKSRFESITTGSVGYTLTNAFPHLSDVDYDDYELLSVSYYDNYSFISLSGWDAEGNSYTFQNPSGFTGVKTTAVTDLTTGSKVRVLGSSLWLNTVIYYDNELRAIQTISENHLGGTDRLTNELDWKGEMSKMIVEHSNGSNDVDILTEYEYEHNGQLLRSWQTINETGIPSGTRVLVADFKYNVLGQLTEKNLHSTNGTSFLQSVDYDYNIKGWTRAINNADLSGGEGDLFGMEYNYTNSVTVNGSNVPGRYDGVVSSLEWNSTNNLSGNGFGKTITGYNYDDRNRLENTKYGSGGGSWSGEANHYDMTASYDENGNISDLTRKADGTTIDNLTYSYQSNSNKLSAVADASNDEQGVDDYYTGTDYAYNSMGNMTSDLNKEIVDIDYNHLQLVEKVEFGDGTEVRSTYDAAGNRLTKEIYDGDNNEVAKVDYVGVVEYLDGDVNQIFTDEGRAYKQNDAYHYEYFLTDHQGNNRVAFGNLPERNIYTATMESEKSTSEESEFAFPANIRSTAHNHTPLANESVALNGTQAGKQVGPAKVLTIADGDEVEIDVWAKYTYGSWNNSSIANIASIISTTFTGASSGTGGEGAANSLSNALSNPGANGLFANGQSQEPRAYLQYIFFDASYAFDNTKSGFEMVGGSSQGKFSKLSSGKIKFTEAGYLFVYVVNESNQNQNVYFDDLRIMHSSDDASFKVSQINEFYPFGLATDKSWRSEGYVDPGLLYQSAYASYDSLTGYYDFLSRNYDPALGRFFQVDPAGQFSSPYAGMGNLPHFAVDPDGELAWFVPIVAGALIGGTAKGIQSHNNGGTFGRGFWQGALVGAAAGAAGIGVSAWASGSSFAAVGSGTASIGFGGTVAGGAAAGFASGSANAWFSGASFGDGLGAGLKGAAVGAVTAGALKGISDGVGKLADRAIEKDIKSLVKSGSASVKNEWAYDVVTGQWKFLGPRGGQKEHFYHIGEWVDGGSAFKGNMFFSTGSKSISAFRIWQSTQSTVSAIIIPTTGLSGYVLEPAGPSTTVAEQDRRIPAGQYDLDWFTRPSGAVVPRLSNASVSQDRLILSHIGNYPDDTLGCQLPGCGWSGGNSVSSSGPMFRKITSYFNRLGIDGSKWNIYDAF